MSKTIRVYLVVAVLAVVGLYVGVKVLENNLVGILIAAIALIGGVYLLRRETEDEGDFFSTPTKTEEREAEAFEEEAETTGPAGRTAEPLATWEPELQPWSPPEADSPMVIEQETVVEEELDVLDLEELERIDEFVEAEAEAAALEETEAAAREEPIDQVEDEEALGVGAPVIDEIEDVHSDDDIMKASHATELSVTGAAAGGSDNSELAKLLAKVQSRLAAYE